MAVIPMWKVDRDDSMHTSKTDADKHDLMLEIGDHFSAAVKAAAADLSHEQAEAIGLFLAKHRDAVGKLCKGSNEALAEAIASVDSEAGTVTPIRAVKS